MPTDETDEQDDNDTVEETKPKPSGRSPMDRDKPRRQLPPLPLMLAIAALVVAVIAAGLAGWTIYALKQATKVPVPEPTEQTSAKTTVCDAVILVRNGIAVNANLQLPGGDNEQIGALLRGANSRVALVTGAEFLQSKLTPAVPADLTDAAQKFSNTLLDIGAAASVGTMNDDPEQANRLHDADTYAAQIKDICNK